MRKGFLLFVSLLLLNVCVFAQPWTYDFGTGTGIFNTNAVSTTFLPTPSSGTARIRIGSGGGSFNLENPGLPILGSNTELRTVAPSTASINKFSIHDYTAGKVFYNKFSMVLGDNLGGNSATSGTWYFFQGDGACFSDNNGFAGTQIFTGIRWTFGASGTIAISYRNGVSWSAALSTPSPLPITQGNVYSIEIYGNNSNAAAIYSRSGVQNLAVNTWDLWINGVLVGNDLSKALLANDVDIDSWMFYGESSTGNVANIFLDDFEYSNALPFAAPTHTISEGAITGSPFTLADCFTTASGSIAFISTGTFNAGNTYTAQLSDAAGSFATPVAIGSITSISNSGNIPFIIPNGTASSSTYKIRIVSSDPVAEGTGSTNFQITQNGICVSATTDFFRSRATGNWNATATWESSATGTAGTWIPATLTPNSLAQVITIRNGHKVNLIVSVGIDEVVIENGGILDNQMPVSEILTIDSGPNDDLEIKSGGVYRVTSTENYANHILFSTGSVIHVRTNGTIQIGNSSAVGGGNSEYASNATNLIWDDGSIFLWNTTITPSIQATFFPGTAPNVIPVFRFNSSPSLSMGGGSPTIINGILDAAMPIIFSGSGSKTFRNGIIGNGKVDGRNGITPSGQFIINGITAELGGTDSLIVPVADGLLIGSVSGTTVNVISDKLVHGNVSLLTTNSYVDLGTNDLTVTGTISGGSTTSYIRTAGTGSLILNNIISNRSAPVGNSTYNPVSIDNTSGYNWSVNVEDLVDVTDPTYIPNVPGAVQRTWNIIPSTNPSATGTTLVFSWDDNPSAVPRQTGVDYNNLENVQIWRKVPSGNPWPYDWIAVGVAQVPGGSVNSYRTATISSWTKFSPFAISTMSKPLPIKLIRFEATKISSSASRLSWELAACCSSAARFEIERSTDARNYSQLTTLPGSETNRFYAYTDTRLAKGITYYRLKMTDADGKISYSNVVALINDKAGLLITSLAPNPVQSQATLTITNAATGPVQFAIYDLRGRLVQQWQANTGEGSSTFTIQLGGLQAGLYHLLASGTGARSVYRFIKQ